MAKSKIEWTEDTWNPTTGCTKISSGCKHCYAERMTKRLQVMGVEKYRNGFNQVSVHPETLRSPYVWKKARMVFVNSMSDLFHKDIPTSFIKDVFSVMNDCSNHTFQILTKRAERLAEISSQLNWTPNIWMGVTIENNLTMTRANHLRITGAKIKFLSLEPLLEKINDLDLNDIDWVIVGGESGPGARALKFDWVSSIRDQCKSCDTSFFFKQWGGINKKKNGRLLDNKYWSEMPNQIDCRL